MLFNQDTLSRLTARSLALAAGSALFIVAAAVADPSTTDPMNSTPQNQPLQGPSVVDHHAPGASGNCEQFCVPGNSRAPFPP